MKVTKAPKELLASSNLQKSEKFYKEVLDLKTQMEADGTLMVGESIHMRQETPWVVYVKETKQRVSKGNRTTEILLEADSLEDLIEKNSTNPGFRMIVPPGKRKSGSMKIYDPDNHIIEISEE